MKYAIAIVLCFVLVFGGFAFLAGSTTVLEGCYGIKAKYGKAQEDVLTPGRHFVNPFSTSVILMDTRWQKYSTMTSAFSKDIQQVDVSVSMNYQIDKDGVLSIYRNIGEDYADKVMLPLLLDSLKSTFSKYSAEELITNRDKISNEVEEELAENLLFYKISVREIAIEDIDFTDAFTDAIESKQVATQKALQTEIEQEQQTKAAQAEAERQKIIAEADAERKLIEAQANADAVKIQADAEAYRIQEVGKELIIELEKIEKWNGELPKVTGAGSSLIVNQQEEIE